MLRVIITLRENEQIIKNVRQHKIFLWPAIFGWPWLVIGPMLIRYLINFKFFGYWPWVLIVSSLITVLIILYRIFIWKRNALIITDQRLVENEQLGLFSKTVTELLYEDVRQISYEKHGVSASLYDFGDIKIRTASDNEIVFPQIAEPDEVVEIINGIRRGTFAAKE